MFVTHPPIVKAQARYLGLVARRFEKPLAAVFLRAVKALRDGTDIGRVELHLMRGNIGNAVQAMNWQAFDDILGREGYAILLAAQTAGARAEIRRTFPNAAVTKILPSGTVSFTLSNPRARLAAARAAADLVRHVSPETRQAIRAIIEQAQRDGIDVREQAARIARLLRDEAGLTEQQTGALFRLESTWRGENLTEAEIQRRWTQQRDLYLRRRANTIAANETMNSVNKGQQEIWREAQEQGLIGANTMREWMTAIDERTCPVCLPMNGQRVKLTEQFLTPDGRQIDTNGGAHVKCRCTARLVPATMAAAA